MYKDWTVLIVSGKGFGQYRRVVNNTAHTLQLDRAWRVVPDGTSEYVASQMYVENAFFANLNNSPLRMSLWLDCIANVVEMHRDTFAKGIDIWGQDSSRKHPEMEFQRPGSFCPAYYNVIQNCWMDGTFANLVYYYGHPSKVHVGPPLFANFVSGNRIRSPHLARTGFDLPALVRGGIVVGTPLRMKKAEGQDPRVFLSHTIVADNLLGFTGIGVAVSEAARKTFLLGNAFQRVDRPILDWGARTVIRSNVIRSITESDIETIPIPDAAGDREIPPRSGRE